MNLKTTKALASKFYQLKPRISGTPESDARLAQWGEMVEAVVYHAVLQCYADKFRTACNKGGIWPY
jgi:hypothetical protein